MSVIVVSFYLLLASLLSYQSICIPSQHSQPLISVRKYRQHKIRSNCICIFCFIIIKILKIIVIEGYNIILQATNNKNTHYCKVEKLYKINKISITCIWTTLNQQTLVWKHCHKRIYWLLLCHRFLSLCRYN